MDNRNRHLPQDEQTLAEKIKRRLLGESNLNDAVPVENITTILQLEPEELALRRDVQVTNNSGTVEFNPSFGSDDVIGVSTDQNTSNSNASLETSKLIQYKSGHRNEAGIGLRKVSLNGSGIAEWGLGADGLSNKILWREEVGEEIKAVIERAGTETRVPTSEWSNTNLRDFNNENGNVDFQVIGYDPFNSSTTLGNQLDTSFGYIYKIDYVWYGHGIIVFSILIVDENGFQRKQPLVGFIPKNQTSLTRINLPIYTKVDNNGESAQNQYTVAGRQAWFAGERSGEKSILRHVIESPGAISNSSYTTIALYKRKDAFVGLPIEIVDVQVVGGGTYDVEVRGRVNDTSMPTYGDGGFRDTKDPIPLQEATDGSVATSNSELTGYPTGGGAVDTTSGPGEGSTTTGELDNQTTALVRKEPGAVVAKEMVQGSNTTPDAVVVTFKTGL